MDTVLPNKGVREASIVAAWFGATFFTLIFSIFLLSYISVHHYFTPKIHNLKVYSALPSENTEIEDAIVTSDGRALIIENFFKGHKSVLANHADTFVSVADKYGLDYRLLPAIAMQESSGAKRVPVDSHNAWGYGVYGDKVLKFANWDAAIERVGRGLKEDYYDKGLTTPDTIMAKYTPPSIAKGGPWAIGVNQFMDELK